MLFAHLLHEHLCISLYKNIYILYQILSICYLSDTEYTKPRAFLFCMSTATNYNNMVNYIAVKSDKLRSQTETIQNFSSHKLFLSREMLMLLQWHSAH